MLRLKSLRGCTGFDGTGKVWIARGRVGCLKDAKQNKRKNRKDCKRSRACVRSLTYRLSPPSADRWAEQAVSLQSAT